jgi:RNA polymerase sigma-70 factor (ECF subfamily)
MDTSGAETIRAIPLGSPRQRGNRDLGLLESMSERHEAILVRWALSHGVGMPEAHDLVQDTFERALRTRPPVANNGELRAWLLVVLRNLFTDRCRSAPIRGRSAVDVEACGAPPEQTIALWRCVDLEWIRQFFPRLPEPMREVFELRAAGILPAAIATRLNVPMATVNVRLHRARALLRTWALAQMNAPATAMNETDPQDMLAAPRLARNRSKQHGYKPGIVVPSTETDPFIAGQSDSLHSAGIAARVG